MLHEVRLMWQLLNAYAHMNYFMLSCNAIQISAVHTSKTDGYIFDQVSSNYSGSRSTLQQPSGQYTLDVD